MAEKPIANCRSFVGRLPLRGPRCPVAPDTRRARASTAPYAAISRSYDERRVRARQTAENPIRAIVGPIFWDCLSKFYAPSCLSPFAESKCRRVWLSAICLVIYTAIKFLHALNIFVLLPAGFLSVTAQVRVQVFVNLYSVRVQFPHACH